MVHRQLSPGSGVRRRSAATAALLVGTGVAAGLAAGRAGRRTDTAPPPAPAPDRALDEVISARSFRMVFQPIVDLRDDAVVGVEALARIPADVESSPMPWFRRAAACGRGAELELLTLRAALEQQRALPDGVYLSVNVSPSTIVDGRFAGLMDTPGATDVVLEVTEHAVVDDYAGLAESLGGIRSSGVRVAVDDAGAGWASLRHVLKLHPEIIKLDRTLTVGIHNDPGPRALAAALVGFAGEVGATVVAEGIECEEQADELRRLGVTHGQGFALGRAEALVDLGL